MVQYATSQEWMQQMLCPGQTLSELHLTPFPGHLNLFHQVQARLPFVWPLVCSLTP